MHWDNVKQFMKLAGQQTPEEIAIPSHEVRKLRATLIMEEALEKVAALGFRCEVETTEAMPEPKAFFEPTGKVSLEEVLDAVL